MNKTIIGVIVLVVVLGGGYLLMKQTPSPTPPPSVVTPPTAVTPPPAPLGEVVITVGNSGYTPDKITIKKDETVKFVNAASEDRWPASNIHPTHQIYPEFDPKRPIPAGQSWSFTFDKVGIWRCHDHLEPTHTCTITVE